MLRLGIPIKAYAPINFTTEPLNIEKMGALTCPYACKIALVVVINPEKKIESDRVDSMGAVMAIVAASPRNKRDKIGRL